MTVSWSGIGGEQLGPPFVVRLAGFGLAPLILNVPTTAWSDTAQAGSYTFNMPWPAGTKFVATMDDGFGFGTGGVTGIQTVKSSSNSSCLTTAITQPEHVFDVFGTFAQCSVVSMNWTQPATSSTLITGLVPNGVAFQLDPPVVHTKSTTWNLNIPRGTAFVLMYNPSSGPGLTSSLLNCLANGGSDTCLSSGAYPSATATQTGVAQVTGLLTDSAIPGSTSSPSSGATGSTRSATNLGAIIGATLGAVAFLSAALVVAFCWFRRKRRFARVGTESPISGKEIDLDSNNGGLDISYGRNITRDRNLPEGAVILPFVLPGTSSIQETPSSSNRKEPFASRTRNGATRRVSDDTFTTSESSSGTPGTFTGGRNRSETDYSEPVVIQHADGGSVPIQPRTREVIELPPNYNQLPRRLPQQPSASDQLQVRREVQRKI